MNLTIVLTNYFLLSCHMIYVLQIIFMKKLSSVFSLCARYSIAVEFATGISQEYVIRFTFSLFHIYSLKIHSCAHTELHICCITHFAAGNGRKFIAGWHNMLSLQSYQLSSWLCPDQSQQIQKHLLNDVWDKTQLLPSDCPEFFTFNSLDFFIF